MADDDHNHRPFRSNERLEPEPRPADNSNHPSDPLAELARLIGQSDPFGEFNRNAERRAAPPTFTPRGDEHAAPGYGGNAYYGEAPAAEETPTVQPALPGDAPLPYGRPSFSSSPSVDAAGADHGEDGVAGEEHEDAADAFEHEAYEPSQAPFSPVEEEFYEDAQPRRRVGIFAIAGVFALAAVGAAGAFGYRALYHPSRSGPPPVIKADTAPSKIPAPKKETQSAKLNDRMNDQAQGNKVVSREEQPINLKRQTAEAFPQAQGGAPSNAIQPALGSGIIAGVGQPRKIHTIVIHPDKPTMGGATEAANASPNSANVTMADTTPVSTPTPTPPEKQTTAVAPPESAPARHAATAHSAVKPKPAVHHAEMRAAHQAKRHHVAQVRSHHTAAAPANAPLSLSPNVPAQTARAPMRTAAVAPPTRIEQQPRSAAHFAGGYAVQISSRHSKTAAEAAFHRLQAKFPGQLGGRQPLIRRVDLGARGVYYRAMVGPFANSAAASQLCRKLKAAGGSCFVQKI